MTTETLGQRLKRIRTERGLKQHQLEVPEIGLTETVISRIETDSREPSRLKIAALARRLGVSVHYLEFGVPDAVYVLLREAVEGTKQPVSGRHLCGRSEAIAATRSATTADSWADIAERADPGYAYRVVFMPIDDTDAWALFAEEYLSSPIQTEGGIIR